MKRDVELGLLDRALERVRDRTRSHADTERRVSVERYHSPDWHRREQDLIFSKVPPCWSTPPSWRAPALS